MDDEAGERAVSGRRRPSRGVALEGRTRRQSVAQPTSTLAGELEVDNAREWEWKWFAEGEFGEDDGKSGVRIVVTVGAYQV